MERLVQCLDELEDLVEAGVLRWEALRRCWPQFALLVAAAFAAALLGSGALWAVAVG